MIASILSHVANFVTAHPALTAIGALILVVAYYRARMSFYKSKSQSLEAESSFREAMVKANEAAREADDEEAKYRASRARLLKPDDGDLPND